MLAMLAKQSEDFARLELLLDLLLHCKERKIGTSKPSLFVGIARRRSPLELDFSRHFENKI